MEKHQQWPLGWLAIGFTKINIHKISIGRGPALAPPLRYRDLKPTRPQGWPNGLQMTARQPRGSGIVCQCSVEGLEETSAGALGVPGLA